MYDIAMPKKVRLLAIKTALSAKLAEGKLTIVDNDYVPERKTKLVAKALENYAEKENILIVTNAINEDFKIASKNIDRISYVHYADLTVTSVLKCDKLMLTIDAVLDIMKYLHESTLVQHKPFAIKADTPTLREVQDYNLAKNGKTRKVPVQVNFY